jgi:hypothetical protein
LRKDRYAAESLWLRPWGAEVETRSDVMNWALVCTGCSHSLAWLRSLSAWWGGTAITAISVLTVIGMLSANGVIGMTIIG